MLMKNRVFTPVFAYAAFGILFMCSAVLVGLYAGSLSFPESSSNAPASTEVNSNAAEAESVPKIMLMLDPGHGGEDGGASSALGLVEKDLNLTLSRSLSSLSMLFGLPASMTRDDDRLLYDYYNEETDYTGKKKSLDLKNRLRITEESGACLLVSIHMNKFSDPRYSGLQVYYSPSSEDSPQLAGAVQSYIKSHLQPENNRQPKAAGSSIYLMNSADIPAVLIECGFLSNPEESRLLGEEDYRASLACTVFAPIAEYLVRQGDAS